MNILLITPNFPDFDNTFDEPTLTKFLYYYAAEWVKQGHNVMVLQSSPRYPRLFFFAMCFFKKFQLKAGQIRYYKQLESAAYDFDGIHIFRTPIKKWIPHRDFLSWHLSNHVNEVLRCYEQSSLSADIVISDFMTPSAYIADEIKRRYNVPFYQVLHQTDFSYLKKSKKLKRILNNSSGILLRSYTHLNRLHQEGSKPIYYDYMFTGIPDDTEAGLPRKRIKKLLYVGFLHESKNIHTTIQIMAKSTRCNNLEFEIIGEGPFEIALQEIVSQLNMSDQVFFSGKTSRENVFKKMREADAFVMISKETYGMVYIEALSQGCIVVAGKNQGVDGIIVDGENGFLVELDNAKALAELLDKMVAMDEQEVQRISKNAIQTASQMKDGQLAKELLDRLSNHLSQKI